MFSLCICLQLMVVMLHRDGRGCPKKTKILTNEHTTLRRHAASFHSVSSFSFHLSYLTWYLATLQKLVQTKQVQLHATW